MASVYPGAFDTFATNKTNSTVTEDDHPEHHNDVASAVNELEQVVGLVLAPDDVADLGAWWQADTLGLSDGDPVSTWPDDVGSNDFTQATGANQPTFQTNEQNGLGVVRFDNTNDSMSSSFSISAGTYTIFAVYKYNSPTASAQRRVVSGGNNWLMGPYNARYAHFAGAFAPNGPGAGNSFRIHTAQFDNRGYHFVDGDFCGSSDGGTYPGAFNLGAAGSISEVADSDVAEVIAYTRSLTRPERIAVDRYLQAKWAL